MKIFSINPNTGKYFKDKNNLCTMDTSIYNGVYKATPVYPRYTLVTNGRYNYTNPTPEIEFHTMLPIKRFFGNYFVEVSWRTMVNPRSDKTLENAIKMFKSYCEKGKKDISIKELLRNT